MPTTLVTRTPRLNGADIAATRQEILAYFLDTFNQYEQLFATLNSTESFVKKSIPIRHPLIFYFGHTATFFVNKLLLAGLLNTRVNEKFEAMFAVGVDEMSWDDLHDEHYDWPSVAAVAEYRNQVRALMVELITSAPLTLPIDWHHPWWAILMCIEHERIHLETSSVLIRQHDLGLVQAHPSWEICPHSSVAPDNKLLNVAAGAVQVDKAGAPAHYSWDNEFGSHHAHIPAFAASQFLVSNGEFLGFVNDGGYANDAHWAEEGLAWKNYAQASQPTFWRRVAEGYKLRLMTAEIAMPWDWPVEVNYHEAKAFCAWKTQQTGQTVRLPSEDEWLRLYDVAGLDELPHEARGCANLHLDYYASPCPVNEFAQGDFYDVAGNVWQWTETPIYPYSGFQVYPHYDDFTVPTFDGRHNLIKGGSWVSCGNQTLRSARYAFRRHFFQHAGFRYVVGDTPAQTPTSNYESEKLVAEYAEFHYGDNHFGVANFAAAVAQLGIAAVAGKPHLRALDLGCASGRSTFELARHFEHVTGIDFSTRLIATGVQMVEQGEVRYSLVDEGELRSFYQRDLHSLGLAETRAKVEFAQGDACNLPARFTGYDLLLAANLIDRLYDPKKFLSEVHERINLGGVLLLTSPYTWLEEHTKRENWIGGFKKNAENFSTLDGLKELLGAHFKLLQAPQDVPFVIRETKRKFQHSVTQATAWQRFF
jgi:5-histidylcysteine sulfoxide synthase/putative 4-mercaptohistidine N1-methyltranferase